MAQFPRDRSPNSRRLRRTPQRRWWLLGLMGIAAVGVGTAAALSPLGDWLMQQVSGTKVAPVAPESLAEGSTLVRVLALPPEPQGRELDALARTAADVLERSRARYLLAIAALNRQDGNTALAWLDRLEDSYPVLTPAILAARARALTLGGQVDRAREVWQSLLDRFPGDAAAAEALAALGDKDPQRLDRALSGGSNLMRHPKILAVLAARFRAAPTQPAPAVQILRLSPDSQAAAAVVEPLETKLGAQLTPEDWEAIAHAHWRRQVYKKAAPAYARATPSATAAYRSARAYQLANQKPAAIAAYEKFLARYPNAPETGLGRVHLASLLPLERALPLLNQTVATSPSEAPRALRQAASRLAAAGRNAEASQLRQRLLEGYGSAEPTAELRWELAQAAAQAGNLRAAWSYAAEIPRRSPESDRAAQASFWVGKWASRLGRESEARQAFEQVLIYYPESYYAWRSAGILGLPVGDFNRVRALQPPILLPKERDRLPVGDAALQELYQLHQDRAAWERWQVVLTNWKQPTMREQWVDGRLRIGAGDYLAGFFQLGNLAFRDEPTEAAEFAQLRRNRAYWESLYPLPYEAIIREWSDRRKLNPLLVAGLIRQESRFEKTARSVAGAMGLMQVLPATADWIGNRAGLSLPTGQTKPDLLDPEQNIALGTWFFDYTHQKYQNNSLLAIASYNAGPGNVDQWLQTIRTSDPDEFVERIPFPETRAYVEAVLGGYWNYLRLYDPEVSKTLATYAAKRREAL